MSVRRVTMNGVARLGVGIALVGRRAEMTALGAALEHAAEGKPTGVLLAGDAGVGKSRLVSETVERAATAGYAVLTGRCLDSSASLPYLPFTEVVGQLVAASPEQLTAHPELARLLPGHVAGEAVDRELGQLRVFDAMLSALDSFTAEAPALLVLEDLHWADRSSRDLLVFLLSRLTAQRLVVLATYRTDDLHRRHPLRSVLSELVRLPAVERLDLAPLGPGDTLDLVQRLANGSLLRGAGAPGRRAQRGQRVLRRGAGVGVVGRAARRARRGADGPHRGPAAGHPAGAAAGRGRRAAGRARSARGRVASCPTTSWTRPCAMPSPTTCSWPTRRRCLRLPARAAARGHLHRAAARRAQQAARPLRQAASPSTAPRRARPPSSPTTRWRPTTCRSRWPPRCGPRGRPISRAAPAEVLLHVERALELWEAVPEPERVSGMTEVRLTTLGGVDGERQRRSRSGHRARPSRARSRRARRRITRSRPRSPAATPCGCSSSAAATRKHSRSAAGRVELRAALPVTPETAWAQAVHARVLCRLDLWDEARASAETALADHRRAGSRRCRRHRRAGRRADQPGDVRRAGGRSPSARGSGGPRRSRSPGGPPTWGSSCAPSTASACRCSTRAGSPRPARRSRRASSGRTKPASRGAATGSICGSRTSSPSSCGATGMPPRRPREIARRVGVGHGRQQARRGRAAHRGRPGQAGVRGQARHRAARFAPGR